MSEYSNVLLSKRVQDKIRSLTLKKKNVWENTELAFYFKTHSVQQGIIGECYVEELMISRGHKVLPRSNPGHDRMIGGYKTEIKFSLQQDKPNDFRFNHISLGKDWQRIIFCGLNVDLSTSKVLWFTKEDFISIIESTSKLSEIGINRAQGGNKMSNDDFFIYGLKNSMAFMSIPVMKHIDEWKVEKIGLERFYND